jgi:hypothetical protein
VFRIRWTGGFHSGAGRTRYQNRQMQHMGQEGTT